MATTNLELSLKIQAAVDGLGEVAKLANEIEQLGGDATAVREKAAGLADEMARLKNQQALIDQFKQLEGAAKTAADGLKQSQAQTRDLALQQKDATAKVAELRAQLDAKMGGAVGPYPKEETKAFNAELKALQAELAAAEKEENRLNTAFERSRASTRDWATAAESARLELQKTGQAMNAAGLDSQKLEVSQARVTLGLKEAEQNAAAFKQELTSLKASTEQQAAAAKAAAEAEKQQADQTKALESALSALGNKSADIQRLKDQFALLTKAHADGRLSAADLATAEKVLNDRIAELDGSAQKTGFSFNKMAGAIGAALAVDRVLAFGKALVDVEAEYGKLRASINTVTDSSEEAAAAWDTIKNFQASAPIYSIEQVTQAWVKLKALGLDPSAESLRSYGNLSAAMGKDIQQFVEAVADAVTGEFERLKEFGIKASAQGDEVAFTFQNVTTRVGNDAKSIEGYLRGIGETKFADGIKNQSEEAAGSLARLASGWEKFKLSLGDQTNIKGGLAWLADEFDRASDRGVALQTVTGRTHGELIKMYQAAERLQKANLLAGNPELAEFYRKKLADIYGELERLAKIEGPQKAKETTQGAAEATDKFSKALEKAGEKSSEASGQLGEFIKQFDLLKPDNADKLALAIARLGGESEGAAKQVREDLAKAFADLTGPELQAEIDALRKKTQDLGPVSAQVADALDIGVREQFRRLGIDADQALTGVSKKTSDSMAALDGLAQSGQLTGKTLKDALSNLLNGAQTTTEIGAVIREIDKLKESGRLSGKALVDAYALAEQAQKRVGVSLEEVRAAQDKARVSADALAKAMQLGTDTDEMRAKAAADAREALRLQAAQSTSHAADLTVAAGKITRAEYDKAAAFRRSQQAAEESANASKKAFDDNPIMDGESVQIMIDPFVAGMQQIATLSHTVADEMWGQQRAWNGSWDAYFKSIREQLFMLERLKEQKASVDDITAALNNAARAGGHLASIAQRAGVDFGSMVPIAEQVTTAFGDLDKQHLTGLISALEQAKQKTDALKASAEQAKNALLDELDQLNGNQQAIEQRTYETRKAELEQKRDEARSLGNDQAAADYQEALDTLEQVHLKKQQLLDGKRAEGGKVTAGKTYLINEHGPETFVDEDGNTYVLKSSGPAIWTAPRDGHIVPNKSTGTGRTDANETGKTSGGAREAGETDRATRPYADLVPTKRGTGDAYDPGTNRGEAYDSRPYRPPEPVKYAHFSVSLNGAAHDIKVMQDSEEAMTTLLRGLEQARRNAT